MAQGWLSSRRWEDEDYQKRIREDREAREREEWEKVDHSGDVPMPEDLLKKIGREF